MNRRGVITSAMAAALAGSTTGGAAQAQTDAPPSGGTSVFADTMAEMTWQEAEAAAKAGASVLWAFGVIEQHGPHLPLGTDVYVPAAMLRRVRVLLRERGHQAVIMPAYYWGINQVSGAFPGSPNVRPTVMIELMGDVFASLKKHGFERVFCSSGHGDALHNRAIFDGVSKGRSTADIDAIALLNGPLAKRLGLDPGSPALATFEVASAGPPPKFIDVHAGGPETSAMLHVHPELVRKDVIATLKSTDFGPADLAEWRKGQDAARRKTPLGYLGNPASANAEQGRARFEQTAQAMTSAILQRVAQK